MSRCFRICSQESLQKDPALRAAVNDELVQHSWLKAFRFSFFCIIAVLVLRFFVFFLLIIVGERRPMLYTLTGTIGEAHFYFFVAIMSCIGSFLRFSRERS